MRKIVLGSLVAFLAFTFIGQAGAADSFQFAPPPFPILNLRAVDVQRNTSIDYIGMKVGDFKFNAANFGGSRAVKYWDRGGFSLGGNMQIIVGTGKFSTGFGSPSDLTLVGFGLGLQPNFYFDLAGEEEDDFSLPFYFGPHLTGNMMSGSMTSSYAFAGRTYSSSIFISVTSLMYGWQAGIQAGVNVGDYFKFIPYLDFSQEMGGTVGTSQSSSYGSSSTSMSVKTMPVVMAPGFDLMFRKVGLSLGGAVQNSKSAGATPGSDTKVKTVVFHLRFQKKFRSICGI